jgi:type II secretory ATPase GspE/PulE/Tfp pilus assembly ATPase PilB-like protein
VIATGVLVDRQSVERAFENAKAGRLVIAILWGLSAEDAKGRLIEIGVTRDDLDRHLLGIFVQQMVDGRCIAEHSSPSGSLTGGAEGSG